jgi:RimJ/RimL family protein N-acetyltransferase
MEIPLSRSVVRTFRAGDAPSLARHANNRRVWINLRDEFPHPYALADARRFIEIVTAADPETHFAIVADGAAAGAVGLHLKKDIRRRSAEIGYWLGEEFWGRDIATEAVRAVTAYAFGRFDLARLYAGAFEWNEASMRVLEKAGYTREARLRKAVTKDGRTIDLLLYATVRE